MARATMSRAVMSLAAGVEISLVVAVDVGRWGLYLWLMLGCSLGSVS